MSEVRKLHDEAMALAEMASVAKLRGDLEQAGKLLRQAYDKESKAAELLRQEALLEPTRSILFRSAASLAIDCNEFREAGRLIAIALSGNPPPDIAEELRDLWWANARAMALERAQHKCEAEGGEAMTHSECLLGLAELKSQCPACSGTGSCYEHKKQTCPHCKKPIIISTAVLESCWKCKGTGKVLRFSMLEQECHFPCAYGRAACECNEPHKASCVCRGRGYVVVDSLEATLEAADKGGYILQIDSSGWATIWKKEPYQKLDRVCIQGKPNEAAILVLYRAVKAEEEKP